MTQPTDDHRNPVTMTTCSCLNVIKPEVLGVSLALANDQSCAIEPKRALMSAREYSFE